jgi:hypothetical protein
MIGDSSLRPFRRQRIRDLIRSYSSRLISLSSKSALALPVLCAASAEHSRRTIAFVLGRRGSVAAPRPKDSADCPAINGWRIDNFKSPLLGSKGSRDHLSPISIVLDDVFLFVCLEGPQFLGRCANVKFALVNYKVIRIDVREPALR